MVHLEQLELAAGAVQLVAVAEGELGAATVVGVEIHAEGESMDGDERPDLTFANSQSITSTPDGWGAWETIHSAQSIPCVKVESQESQLEIEVELDFNLGQGPFEVWRRLTLGPGMSTIEELPQPSAVAMLVVRVKGGGATMRWDGESRINVVNEQNL